MFSTPILFLIFNRPDTTEKVFEKIREIKPRQLFVAADGPREASEKDRINCEAARVIATNVDWDCEVKTLFRDRNLGCGLAVSKAISWFFDNVNHGIILEDDVLPSISFFSFCEELLMLYKDDSEIMHISGCSFLPRNFIKSDSYYFTKYPYVWGWATWKRAWDNFDYHVKVSKSDLEKLEMKKDEKQFWLKIMKDLDLIDTWDYRWNFSIWSKDGMCISATKNLVRNIGFGYDATHTMGANPYYEKLGVAEIPKIVHPETRKINRKADLLILNRFHLMKISIKDRIVNKLKKIFN